MFLSCLQPTRTLSSAMLQQQTKTLSTAYWRNFILSAYTEKTSLLRKNAIACVALPTCPLALAEGQRYMPVLISKIEPLLDKYGLAHQDIIMRMTGCPNGCARPVCCRNCLCRHCARPLQPSIGRRPRGYALKQSIPRKPG